MTFKSLQTYCVRRCHVLYGVSSVGWQALNASRTFTILLFCVRFHLSLNCCHFIELPVILNRLFLKKASRHLSTLLEIGEDFKEDQSNKLKKCYSGQCVGRCSQIPSYPGDERVGPTQSTRFMKKVISNIATAKLQ